MVSKLYRQVACKDRLPTQNGKYHTDKGLLDFRPNRYHYGFTEGIGIVNPEFWYEEIELPTEEEINKPANDEYVDSLRGYSAFKKGAEWVINKIKGGK